MALSRTPRLLLFDIDGTLVRCGPQVRPLFCGALIEVFGGHLPLDGFHFAGKTDPQIVLELAAGQGLGPDEIHARLPAMRTLYHQRLAAGLDATRMVLLPGARDAVARIAAGGDRVVGLLTGNWRDCAQVKLDRFDLWRGFPFGAFGDDAVDRRDLVPIALERAHGACGRRFTADQVLIIGDSPRDIDCAHAHGARCLAVATGFSREETLRRAGADWVYPDLAAALADHDWLVVR